MTPDPTFHDDLRALYRGPLTEFVGARQALAQRLKAAGDARAAEVRELRKPSASAWGVNLLFGGEPREMAALLSAGERVRAVQRHVAAGGDSAPLRDAIAAVRAALPRLVALGAKLLAANGRAPADAIVEQMRINLEALALDPAHAAIAARGWLDEDLPRPGFEVMAALQLAAATPAASIQQRPSGAAPGRSGAAPSHARRTGRMVQLPDVAREAAAHRDRERRERIEQLRRELATAERAAAEAATAAGHAAETLERAARAAAETAERAAVARARAAEARRAASAAERAAARAREALERFEGR